MFYEYPMTMKEKKNISMARKKKDEMIQKDKRRERKEKEIKNMM